jgi:hypothetical protein
MNNSRQAPRMRMLQSGKIMLGSWGVPCTIRNLSETGACLEVQTTYGIPAAFELVMPHDRRKTCKVIWLDGSKLGVQFQ